MPNGTKLLFVANAEVLAGSGSAGTDAGLIRVITRAHDSAGGRSHLLAR